MRIILTFWLLLCLLNGANAQTDTAAALDAVLSQYHAKEQFDGVCGVGVNGRVVFGRGYGYASRAAKTVPVFGDTTFPVCSITKQFTAVLVLQQAAAGKLNLKSPVERYLPGFRAGEGITLQDLLTHTSGLANMDNFLPDGGFYTRKEAQFSFPWFVIKTYLQGPLLSKPGTKFVYNNADYVVLQAMLERVTHKSYAALLQEKILAPCGMIHTGFITQGIFPPFKAVGSVTDKGQSAREPYINYANFGAAGAMYSTALDLLRYSFALDKGTLLPAFWQAKLFTPVPGLGYEGLSTWVYNAHLPGGAAPLLQERDGETGGFRTLLLRAPNEKIALVLLGNSDASEPGHVYMGQGLAFDLLRVLYPPAKKD